MEGLQAFGPNLDSKRIIYKNIRENGYGKRI